MNEKPRDNFNNSPPFWSRILAYPTSITEIFITYTYIDYYQPRINLVISIMTTMCNTKYSRNIPQYT